MKIRCRSCDYSEDTNVEFFVKLIGGALPLGGYWAWVTYFFAGTGLAMPIVVAMIAGGAGMFMFKNKIVKWIMDKRYQCPQCGAEDWEAIPTELDQEIKQYKHEKSNLKTDLSKSEAARQDEQTRRHEAEEELRELLEQIASEQSEGIQNALRDIKNDEDNDIEVIRNSEHRQALHKAITDSEDHLVITSGWLRIKAIKKIEEDLRNCLQRGADVTLVYGYTSRKTHALGDDGRNQLKQGLELIGKLNNEAKEKGYDKRIRVYELSNHAKAVIVDERYAIVGSSNWLSNVGYDNKELSLEIPSPKLAKRIRDIINGEIQLSGSNRRV